MEQWILESSKYTVIDSTKQKRDEQSLSQLQRPGGLRIEPGTTPWVNLIDRCPRGMQRSMTLYISGFRST